MNALSKYPYWSFSGGGEWQSYTHISKVRPNGGEGVYSYLHAVVATRSLTTHHWEGRTLFLSEPFLMDNDQSLFPIFVKSISKMFNVLDPSQPSLLEASFYLSPRPAMAFVSQSQDLGASRIRPGGEMLRNDK